MSVRNQSNIKSFVMFISFKFHFNWAPLEEAAADFQRRAAAYDSGAVSGL